LFGVRHEGLLWVAYFDSESTHRHFELIPWEDYNVNSKEDFIELAEISRRMSGIWREQVRDHVAAEAEVPETPWNKEFRDYLRQFID
jgi:signal recognition particle subunit SEC65